LSPHGPASGPLADGSAPRGVDSARFRGAEIARARRRDPRCPLRLSRGVDSARFRARSPQVEGIGCLFNTVIEK
jgi:hypothetical protein